MPFQLSGILPMSETKHLCLVRSLSLSCKDRCWHVKEILKCRVPRGIMTGEESKTCILALAAQRDTKTKEMRSLQAVRRNQPCDFCIMPFYSSLQKFFTYIFCCENWPLKTKQWAINHDSLFKNKLIKIIFTNASVLCIKTFTYCTVKGWSTEMAGRVTSELIIICY